MVKKVLVGYGIDVDAVSGWINTQTGAPAGGTDVSRGIFGATVGVDRLLNLWKKYEIKTSWFVPAHSVESFPKQIAKIRDAGHEIGLHGYTHEFVAGLSEQQERDVLQKSIEVLTNFTGQKPRGWTAPAWATSPRSIKLLEEFGIEYDHSMMHHDCQMYYAPDGSHTWTETNLSQPAGTWMSPMSALKSSSIVEVPANWHLDDWPPMQHQRATSSSGFINPHDVEQLWKEQFQFFYRGYESFVFPISIHPQVSGKPQVVLMHERLIEWINGHEGVEWCMFEEMVRRFKSGEMEGVVVEGGVDL